MAYLLAAFCLFIVVAALIAYYTMNDKKHVQISYGEMDLLKECLKEIEYDSAQWEKSAIHLDVREAARKIKGKALIGINICRKNMRDRV